MREFKYFGNMRNILKTKRRWKRFFYSKETIVGPELKQINFLFVDLTFLTNVF